MRYGSRISFTLIVIALVSGSVIAAEKQEQDSVYPRDCSPKAVKYEGSNLIFAPEANDNKYRVFVVYNNSDQPVQMVHPQPLNALLRGWNTIIEPNHYSAVMINHDNWVMSCKDKNGDQAASLNCQQVVKACEQAVSPVMLSAQGIYWITENQEDKSDLFAQLRHNGVFP